MPAKTAIYAEAEKVFKRDEWTCKYCGLNGRQSFAAWRSLTWDHLVPRHDSRRDNRDFIVTACGSCNMKLCQYWLVAQREGTKLDSLSETELLARRREYIRPFLYSDEEYWRGHVAVKPS
jgi:hypothetical protein